MGIPLYRYTVDTVLIVELFVAYYRTYHPPFPPPGHIHAVYESIVLFIQNRNCKRIVHLFFNVLKQDMVDIRW